MIPLPSQASLADLDAALRATDHAGRVAWMYGLPAKELRALWDAAEGRHVPLSYLHRDEGETVVHVGRNSMLLFSHFEKHVMLRGGVVQGFNRQFWEWASGPGHFTAVEEGGTALFDYTQQPLTVPSSFPALRSWWYGVSWFAYGDMKDSLRRVSEDVVVGGAVKLGKDLGVRFLLVRTPRG